MKYIIFQVRTCEVCEGQRANEPPFCPKCNGIGTVSEEITLRELFDELGCLTMARASSKAVQELTT